MKSVLGHRVGIGITFVVLGLVGMSCASSGKTPGVFANVDEYDARLFSLPGQGVVAETAPVLPPDVVPVKVVEAPIPAAPVVAPVAQVHAFSDTTSLLTFPGAIDAAPAAAAEGSRSIASVAPVVAPAQKPTADQAYASLIRGNERFIQGALEHRNQNETRRRAIAGEQNPFAVVLSSSDSRVPPELIFDQGLGDLYVIRVGGGVLGSAQVAAIEYAVSTLGAPLILVLGNESSSEIQKALRADTELTTDQKWLASEIKNNLKSGRFPAGISEDPKLREAAKANVDAVTNLLYVRSSLVKKKIQAGEVKLVRGVYGVESGKVEFWKFGETPAH